MTERNNSKFMTIKWNIVNDQSNASFDVGTEIIYKKQVLKTNLCDYNDPYILVKCDVTVTAAHATHVSFKNCAPFTNCITKMNGTIIDDTEDLNLVMPMYNLIECSINNSEATGSLWFYSNDEAAKFNNDTENTNTFKSLKYKAKLLVNTVPHPSPNNATGILKYSIN